MCPACSFCRGVYPVNLDNSNNVSSMLVLPRGARFALQIVSLQCLGAIQEKCLGAIQEKCPGAIQEKCPGAIQEKCLGPLGASKT
jgi:hypothetical protein